MRQLSNFNEQFLNYVLTTAEQHGVNVFLSKQRSVKLDEYTRSNGYFNDLHNGKPRLAVACGQETQKWFEILVHESSHMDQWIEKSFYWDRREAVEGNGSSLIGEWLDGGHDLIRQKVFKEIDKVILLEADCEIRSAKKIKKFKLDIDLKTYCKKANAYIYFQHVMKKSRAWYQIGLEPYSIEEIYSSMPSKMLDTAEEYLVMPPGLIDLYLKHYPIYEEPKARKVKMR